MPTPEGLVLSEEGGRSRLQHLPRRRRWVGRVVVLVVLVAVVVSAYVAWQATQRVFFTASCRATANGTSLEFTPEQTANAALIAAVSVERGLPPRAATIAIATAIQESKLRNLTYGDRDSVGLFQQRPSQGWGTRAEILDPMHATNAFYDALVKVADYTTRPITEVAQAVQRSGAPEAYAAHEQEGRILSSTLTGQSPAGLGCRLAPVTQPFSGASVLADLTAQHGVSARLDGDVITATAPSTARAWAVAQWAVARGDAYGVQRVTVAGRQWSRGEGSDALAWGAGSGGGAGGDSAETTVVIDLTHPAG